VVWSHADFGGAIEYSEGEQVIGKCPPPQTLEAIAAGDEPSAQLRAHTETCPACRALIQAVRSNPRAIRDAGGPLRAACGEVSPADVSRGPLLAALPPAVPGFELLEEISRGGQGVVYRAVQTATKRPAAVKMLLWGAFSTVRQQNRFEREIEIAARLRHPNIVTIFESGVSTDGRRYVAMEYVEGRPLDRFVETELATLSPRARTDRVIELIAKVAFAVGHAHASGVIHRDIKPSNILVDSAGVPRMLDFGLARELESISDVSLTQEFVGTPAYAAPEQFAGDPAGVDARSDVYSLGVVLYATLTGVHPYPCSSSLAATIEQVRSTEPFPPSRHVPRLPADVDIILLQSLAKDPARRYATAQAMADDLECFRSGRPISARRDSTFYVLRKLAARHRVPVAAAAITLLVVVVAVIVLAILSRGLDQQRRIAEAALAESDLQRARLLAKTGNTVQAEQLLWRAAISTGLSVDPGLGLEASPQQRRAAWALMELYCVLPRQMLVKSTRSPAAAGFGPNLDAIWIASQYGATESWSLDGACLARTPELLAAPATGLNVSADGTRAVTPYDDNVLLLDFAKQALTSYVPEPSTRVRWAAVNPRGDAIAIGEVCGNVRVIDWEAQATCALLDGNFTGGRWDGDFLFLSHVAGGAHRIDAYQPFEHALISELRLWDARPETANAGVAAMSPDGTGAAAICHVGLGLFSLNSPDVRQHRIQQAPFSNVPRFAPDGRTLLTAAYDGTICTWSLPDLVNQRTYRGMRTIQAVAYGGPLTVTAHVDGTLALWRTSDSPWLERVRTSGKTTHGLALSHDGRLAAAGDDSGQLTLIRIADAAAYHCCAAHADIITAIDFSPHDDCLTTFGLDGAVRDWSVEGELIRERAAGLGKLWCGRYSPDGRWIAAAGADGRVFLWQTDQDAPPRVFADHAARAPELAFSPDSRLLVSVAQDGNAAVRDLASGGAALRLGDGFPNMRVAAFAPDSRTIAIGSDDRALSFWDAYSGRLLRTLSGLPWGPFDLQYDPSGNVLFVVGRGTEILVVDPIACTELATLPAHDRLIFKLRLDSAGRRLLTAGEDDWIGIWDTDHLRECVRGNAGFHGGRIGNPTGGGVRLPAPE
jgi:WD40 repeat protein/predicted Ser/Thr protein kinase